MQARRRAQPSATNRPSSSLTHAAARRAHARSPMERHAAARVARGRRPCRAHRLRLRERLPRARPWRGGSPDPVPNSEVKPLIAESTAAQGCGRVGCRARRGRFLCARGPDMTAPPPDPRIPPPQRPQGRFPFRPGPRHAGAAVPAHLAAAAPAGALSFSSFPDEREVFRDVSASFPYHFP